MATLVSDIIRDSYRESNLIAIGTEPSGAQVIEAMRFINRMVPSVLGFEAGEPLTTIYSKNLTEYDDLRNIRLSLSSARDEITLPDAYEDGLRFAVSDPLGILKTNKLTIKSGSAQINGQSEIEIDEPVELFYRADLGDWRVVSPLTEIDAWPFPIEFDDMFIIMMAYRLNPRYNIGSAQESLSMYRRSLSQFRARYNQSREIRTEIPVCSLDSGENYAADFNSGRAKRW